MTIFTDGIHMMSDVSVEELHEFAKRLGMRQSLFQNHPLHPHYDIPSDNLMWRAVHLGAKLVKSKELVFQYIRKRKIFREGCRVLVTGGMWTNYLGEYHGQEKTSVGLLHRIELDAGMTTLVSDGQIIRIAE